MGEIRIVGPGKTREHHYLVCQKTMVCKQFIRLFFFFCVHTLTYSIDKLLTEWSRMAHEVLQSCYAIINLNYRHE